METLPSSLVGFAGWLLRTSWQASVLIGLVLLAQWIFQKRLLPRWRYGLWLLVLIRLLLPVAPATPFSIFNYANRTSLLAPKTGPAPALPAEPLATTASPAVPPAPSANAQPAGTGEASSRPNQLEVSSGSLDGQHGSRPARPWSWPHALSLLWLGGALLLAVRILRFPFRLTVQLAQHETATGPAVFDVLEQAKRLVGMRKVLPIVQSRAVKSPALMGFIRPWLLLPHGMVERLTPQELRFVFLHELAHLKRRDIAVNWLMTILQVLHWFNPLVWFAFNRMRADRELACDELALSFAKAEDNKSYGQAIIKLLEGFAQPAMVPSLVGILEDANQMKKRIAMIAQFKPGSRGTVLAGLLFAGMGLMTLTDAQTRSAGVSQSPPDQADGSRPLIIRTLVTGGGQEAMGILSPDETRISYVDWDQPDSALLAIKDLKSGERHVLTEPELLKKGTYCFPDSMVWSPDARWLAYNWNSDGEHAELRIAPVTNGPSRLLKDGSSDLNFVPSDWSSDGEWILCLIEKRDQTKALGMVSQASRQVRELASFPETGPVHARFSPDGKWVVYEYAPGGNRDVYVLEVETQQTKRLTDSPAEEGSPVWTCDGSHIVFSSNRRGVWDLLEISMEQGRPMSEPRLLKYDLGAQAQRVLDVRVPPKCRARALAQKSRSRLASVAAATMPTYWSTSEPIDGGIIPDREQSPFFRPESRNIYRSGTFRLIRSVFGSNIPVR